LLLILNRCGIVLDHGARKSDSLHFHPCPWQFAPQRREDNRYAIGGHVRLLKCHAEWNLAARRLSASMRIFAYLV